VVYLDSKRKKGKGARGRTKRIAMLFFRYIAIVTPIRQGGFRLLRLSAQEEEEEEEQCVPSEAELCLMASQKGHGGERETQAN
jgi:hypothetical protein